MDLENRPFSVGPLDAKICLVGEAPGADEARWQATHDAPCAFVGAAGKLLNQLLGHAGLVRERLRIENCFQFHPPNNDITPFLRFGTKNVKTSDEFLVAAAGLKQHLLTHRPNVVVPLGNTALYLLTGERAITKWRGSVMESTLIPGLKVIPTIHPSAALREYLMSHMIVFDLARIKRESEFPEIRLPEYNMHLFPNFEEAISFIQKCRDYPLIAFDVEVGTEELYCFSLAIDAKTCMCVPLVDKGQDYFNPPQEAAILSELAKTLETTPILGQNLAFDASFMFRKYGIRVKSLHDTMIAQAILYPDFPKGLDFITSIWTDQPYYKDEGKKHIRGIEGGSERFFRYNALDSLVCQEAMPKMLHELEVEGNIETYAKQAALIPALTFMAERGVLVDHTSMHELSQETEHEIVELEKELEALVGDDWRPTFPNSPKQIAQYLYVKKGYNPVIYKGKVTTNEKALKKLAGKGIREAQLILAIRKRRKLRSTYYQVVLEED